MDDNIFVLNIKGGVVEKIAEPAALKPEADKDVERKVIARLLNPDAPKKADGSAAPAQSRPAPKQAWGIAAPPQPKPAAPGTVTRKDAPRLLNPDAPKRADVVAAPAQPKPAAPGTVKSKDAPRLLNPDAPKRAGVVAAPAQPKPAAPKRAGVVAAPAQPKPAAPKRAGVVAAPAQPKPAAPKRAGAVAVPPQPKPAAPKKAGVVAAPAQPKPAAPKKAGAVTAPAQPKPAAPKRAGVVAAPPQPKPAAPKKAGAVTAPAQPKPAAPKRAGAVAAPAQPKPAAPKKAGAVTAPAQPKPAAVKVVGQKEKAGPSAAEAPKADYCDMYAAPVHRLPTLLAYLFMAAVIYGGWLLSDEEYLIAESGPGYVLGIVGGAMMLMLLLYPLRKKMRFMRKWGPIKYWFKGHMLLGVIGPVLILFHAGFRLGSLNSSVAMATMLLVAVSGLVGRYIYARIHYGLYGRQMNLKELQSNLEDEKSILKHVLSFAPALQKRILAFDDAVLRPRYSLLSSVGLFLYFVFYSRFTYLMLRLGLRRTLKIAAKRLDWSPLERKHQTLAARTHISIHMATALRVSRFRIFERLFALWNLFHLPLFIVLVLVAVAHVIAVHMF